METLQELINNPSINVFDILVDKKSNYGFKIHTYRRPGESDDDFYERDNRNFKKAFELKTKKPA
jgi:hypothetical protein